MLCMRSYVCIYISISNLNVFVCLVRQYLDQTVVPLLLQGMAELVKVRYDLFYSLYVLVIRVYAVRVE